MEVIVYHSIINKLGGIETFLLHFIKRMHDKVDITLIYNKCDEEQLERLSQYVICIKFTHQQFECKTLILASAWGRPIIDNVIAKKVIQMVHADYKHYQVNNFFTYKHHPKVTDYVCVSKQVAKSFKELHGFDSTVIYNLINNEQIRYKKRKNNKLTLGAFTRLSPEKGIERMIDFAKLIPVDYDFYIYGSTTASGYMKELTDRAKGTKIQWMGFKDDVNELMSKMDYVVLLSDTEGFSYTLQEALYQLTPVLVTPFPSAHENIIDGVNGYFVDFDLKNIDMDKIINHIPNIKSFEEMSDENDWLKIIEAGKREKSDLIYVEVIKRYYDRELDKKMTRFSVFKTTEKRSEELINAKVCKLL